MYVGESSLLNRADANRRRAGMVAAFARQKGRMALVLALLSMLCSAEQSKADMTASPDTPAFTPTDLALIHRNRSLQAAVDIDPWLALRVVRALSSQDSAASRALSAPDQDPAGSAEVTSDPDLQISPRTTPEAAQDLFLLMKKVGSSGGIAQKGDRPAPLQNDVTSKIGP